MTDVAVPNITAICVMMYLVLYSRYGNAVLKCVKHKDRDIRKQDTKMKTVLKQGRHVSGGKFKP